MTIKNKKKLSCGAVFAAFAVVLSGCTGTSTYGTGKSQERQLFDDITGIVALGGGKKKERIDYSSRSGLVKPPSSTQLPAPAESVNGSDGYFPESPEAQRARLLRQIDEAEANGTALPPEAVEARRLSAAAQKKQRPTTRNGRLILYHDGEEVYDLGQAKLSRDAVLRQRAELKGAQGAAPRKYLTEPKRIYRTPADTAVAGVIGEEAHDPTLGNKKKRSIWDVIRGK